MILLVTPSEHANEFGEALRTATGEEVTVAPNLAHATTLLRSQSYRAAVFDQYLLEAEPLEAEATLSHVEDAIPVQVNLAISGKDRMAREVKSALLRRQREEAGARRAAIHKMQSELNGTVTALLLCSELALKTPDLPVAVAEKLKSIHELVKKFQTEIERITSAKDADAAKA